MGIAVSVDPSGDMVYRIWHACHCCPLLSCRRLRDGTHRLGGGQSRDGASSPGSYQVTSTRQRVPMPAPEPGGQIPTRTQSQGSTGSHQDPGTNTNTLSLGSTPKGGGGLISPPVGGSTPKGVGGLGGSDPK